jgi:hypothetical protein
MKNEDQPHNKLPLGKKKRSFQIASPSPKTREISFFAVKSELPPEAEAEKQNKIQNRKNNTSSIDKKLDELTAITQKNNTLLNNNESKNYNINSSSNETKVFGTNNFSENVKNTNTNTNVDNQKIKLDSKNIYSVQKESSILNNTDSTNQAKIFSPTFISRTVNPYLTNTVKNVKSYNIDTTQNTNPYSSQNIENKSFLNVSKNNSSAEAITDLNFNTKNNVSYSQANLTNNDPRYTQTNLTNNDREYSETELINNNPRYTQTNLTNNDREYSETELINNNTNTQSSSTDKNFSISNYKNNLYDNLQISENEFDARSPKQYLNINQNSKTENINSVKKPQRFIKNGINMIKFENINQEIPTFAAGGEAVVTGQSLIEVGTDINNNPKTERLKVQADPEMDRVKELIQLTSYKEKETKSNSNTKQIMTIPTESAPINSPPPSSNNFTIKSMSTLDEVLMHSTFVPSWRSYIA